MSRASLPPWLVVSGVLIASSFASAGCSDDGAISDLVDAGRESDAAPPSPVLVPEFYPADRTLSPLTPYVADNLRSIAAREGSLRDDVFAKFGADSMVSNNFMHCLDDGFANPEPGQEPGDIDLDGRTELVDTIAFFREGDAGSSNPYRRSSRAARVGMEVAQITAPGPVDASLFALEMIDTYARFAVIAVGENDLPDGDFDSFGGAFLELVDLAANVGIIPIVTSMAPRADDPALAAEVAHYNEIVRAVAQARQVPFIDVYRELAQVPGQGLGEDGVLLSAYRPGGPDGPAHACAFTAEGLMHGYNVRNLRTLETLDRLRRAVIDGDPAPDSHARTITGTGSAADPFVIDGLPFTHAADTSAAGTRAVDSYPGCQANQDESGPELTYRLELTSPTRIRAMVIDRGTTDIDVHILSGSPDGDACVERAHQLITADLVPGTYYFNLDTYVGQAGELTGEYLFVLTEEP